MHTRRPRRPYEKKNFSKSGAVIFGIGLVALLGTAIVFAIIMLPGINRRLENLPLYARTYYRKLIPHPEYLPTPALAASTAGTIISNSDAPNPLEQPATQLTSTPSPPPTPTVDAAATLPQVSPAEAAEHDPETTDSAGNSPLDNAPSVDLQPVVSGVQLEGFAHQWQTWNNCGPATVTMNTSYFGRPETQVDAAKFLKPNKEDKNVNPQELAAYARSIGMEAMVRQGGSIKQLKQFLSNDIPIIAETWLTHDGDGLGHYRLLTGFDDAAGQFNTFDSLNGPGFTVDYAQFDSDWRVFNRLYVVIYPAEAAQVVAGIIGPDLDDAHMYERLAAQAQAEIAANPEDAIAYFNRGDALTRLKQYQAATAAFDQARRLGLHWRRLWYQFTPFEAYYAVERYQDVLALAKATIAGTGGLEEAYYYQGLALYATGQNDPTESFEAAIAYNPNFAPAREALNSLAGGQ